MSSFFQKKHLNFAKEETNTKSNPDYFNLKSDRAKEEKQEKVQSFMDPRYAVLTTEKDRLEALLEPTKEKSAKERAPC